MQVDFTEEVCVVSLLVIVNLLAIRATIRDSSDLHPFGIDVVGSM